MKKILMLGCLLLSTSFFLSCEAWEDESYHPGGNTGDGMLLKEVKTTTNGGEAQTTYTYDAENRVKEIYHYSNILDMESYAHTVNTYSGDTNYTSVTNTHQGGVIESTTTVTAQINGNLLNLEMEMEVGGEVMMTMTNEMTFTAPCGVTENLMNLIAEGMPPMEVLITYQYTDANCSYKEFQNGDLTNTVTNDDKFSPYTTPEAMAMGIVQHNYIKMEGADGTIENVTYTYNENGYPTKAVHTFSGTSEETNFTEEFFYY